MDSPKKCGKKFKIIIISKIIELTWLFLCKKIEIDSPKFSKENVLTKCGKIVTKKWPNSQNLEMNNTEMDKQLPVLIAYQIQDK